MNVYQKLQKCRVELKTLEIKESGNNKFAGYTYMELGDFLPHIVDLCDKHNLCTMISFTKDEATLTIVNAEKQEEVLVFASPMSTADLKGCHPVQNLGAIQTYLRRYLYVAAFDIVEHDALDSTQGKEEKPKQQRQQESAKSAAQGQTSTTGTQPQGGEKKATEGQVKLLNGKITKSGIPRDDFKAKYALAHVEDLPMSKVNDAIKWLDEAITAAAS